MNYYFMPFFLLPFIWLGFSFTLLVISFIQIIKIFKEGKSASIQRILKATVFILLFLMTFFQSFTDRIIEKADWIFFYNRRMEIVNQVKKEILNPNVNWNGWVCELPFEFPVVSNGGNDIGIFRNKENGAITVTFWVFRDYFESPSTYLIYTNDPDKIKTIEKKISTNPKENWKIEESWFRTYGD